MVESLFRSWTIGITLIGPFHPIKLEEEETHAYNKLDYIIYDALLSPFVLSDIHTHSPRFLSIVVSLCFVPILWHDVFFVLPHHPIPFEVR